MMPSLELASPESRPPIIHSRTGRMTSYPIVDDRLIAEGGAVQSNRRSWETINQPGHARLEPLLRDSRVPLWRSPAHAGNRTRVIGRFPVLRNFNGLVSDRRAPDHSSSNCGPGPARIFASSPKTLTAFASPRVLYSRQRHSRSLSKCSMLCGDG